ncbi:unnamed protein product [Paramecium sonneborni]|uniref:Uncharacterized protein n=1 Tax=Paramecium sonneborni TaxID=65129 RepID=A0A8S1PR31_9CILI|nr:unnamed protein product [Paramecium sonneborni]
MAIIAQSAIFFTYQLNQGLRDLFAKGNPNQSTINAPLTSSYIIESICCSNCLSIQILIILN